MQNIANCFCPQISVAIVTYNCISTLSEAIDSVLDQDYDNVELVIVDGASDDGTVELIRSKKGPIKWISEKDKGIYDAMNKALNMASGDFLIFLGSDDHFITNNTLSKVVSYITDTTYIYYGNVLRSQTIDVYCKKFNKFKLASKNICHQSIFYPRTIYKKYQYKIDYRLNADYYYNLNLWGDCHFVYVPVVVSYYSQNGESSNAIDKTFEKDKGRIVFSNLGILPYLYSKVFHFIRNLIK